MQRVFETFITRMSGCIDDSDFRETMAIAAREFEIERFAYFSLPGEPCGEPHIISNYPQDWRSRYREKAYHQVDPVVCHMRNAHEPFLWPSGSVRAADLSHASKFFREASEFGIGRGMTIPIHDRYGRFAAVTFAAAHDDEKFAKIAATYRHALQLMVTCFHIQVRKRFSGTGIVDGISLTKRELECLQWAARGKSTGDTAIILGIKRRTVTFHLDNVRRKFEVRTVAQAIAILAASSPKLL